MPPVRLTDVAHDAGVSLASASRVLNGSDRVPGKDVADRVRASATRLGYVTNLQAQALARSRTGFIGLVVHDISDPYFATMARAIQQRAFASDNQVLLTQTDRDPATETRAIRGLIGQRVDAIVLLGSHRYSAGPDDEILALLRAFEADKGRVVAIGQELGVGATLFVDDASAARDLALALVVAGHRRFAVVSGTENIPAIADRTGGFLAGLAEAGFEAELSVPARLDREGGHALGAAVAEHLGEDRGEAADPLCVFAPADVMALGALGELRRRGISVPERAGVAGFGGVPQALDSNPPLTTLTLPLTEMADRAIDWVLTADPLRATSDRVGGEVVLRGSTESTRHDRT